ncbi:hypothetical protein [Aquibacillus saliphilus]|uniref:hypothetical protein n=1 Tax=Aquibacillus saliphilus TaxID=1909422 RepID=UPI001CF06C09|nr:hypothetical protein [Aquibacillus saliphilus]
MDYMYKYKNRLQSNGGSLANQIFNDSKIEFEENLSNPLFSQTVTVDGVQKQVSVSSTADPNKRRILFKENDINWGDIVLHESQQWLVTERPFFNRIHDKSKMTLCNNTLTFEVENEREIIGYDDLYNPIYADEATTTIVEFPCVIDNISNLKTPTGEKINVPEGDMALFISYTTNELINEESVFQMFNNDYRIVGIDKSGVLNEEGILMLVAKRIAKSN